jgi:hypothetical protein
MYAFLVTWNCICPRSVIRTKSFKGIWKMRLYLVCVMVILTQRHGQHFQAPLDSSLTLLQLSLSIMQKNASFSLPMIFIRIHGVNR